VWVKAALAALIQIVIFLYLLQRDELLVFWHPAEQETLLVNARKVPKSYLSPYMQVPIGIVEPTIFHFCCDTVLSNKVSPCVALSGAERDSFGEFLKLDRPWIWPDNCSHTYVDNHFGNGSGCTPKVLNGDFWENPRYPIFFAGSFILERPASCYLKDRKFRPNRSLGMTICGVSRLFCSLSGDERCKGGASLLSDRLPHFLGLIPSAFRQPFSFAPEQESRNSEREREQNQKIIARINVAPVFPPPIFFLLSRIVAALGVLYFLYRAIDAWAEREFRDARIYSAGVCIGLIWAIYGQLIGIWIALACGYGT